MKKNGKLVRLVHNPTAGEGEYSKERIIELIESHGYRCAYSSSKKKLLKMIEPETAFIVIAGGDGTIRKTIMRLLNKKLKYKRPIALLPFGTANNIATSLNIPEDNTRNISSWAGYHLKKFDVGQVTGLQKASYFIESFGFGLFPRLMKTLKKMNRDHINSAEGEFEMALKALLEITRNYLPVPFRIEVNDKVIEGRAIMIEIMNISSLGPHLKLSEDADSEDGYFDLVIVTERQRKKMEDYVLKKMEQKDPVFPIKPIRTKSLSINWKGYDVHGDDQVIKVYDEVNLEVSLLDSLLEMVTATK
ncbi:MAG TPA: diacylglycerol kinase family protein [Pedobacter sp.]|uniref:diacylglycerol/lipid kinase family protein n=1 Tax=Pedobacter sp. TaxID=1411316 RepID=UPI002CC2F6A2|nr:diacylglycerol kinase family protein [Pedobacter sp.]HMI05562.1 diacylglycerol kinase family protein [Pedobacter sp.]